MPYVSDGSLTAGKRTINDGDGWDSQSDWEAYQSASMVEIVNGTVQLAERTVPAEEDLYAWYDATALSASDGDSVSTWLDQSGNAHDLTAGVAPVYQTSVIDGNPIVRFNGSDTYLNTTFSSEAVPNTICTVMQLNTVGDFYQYIYDGSSADETSFHQNNNSEWAYGAGTRISDGTTDTNPHIITALYNGSNSVLRIDGTEVLSGDAGTAAIAGLVMGRRPDGKYYADVDMGELLFYPMDKSSIFGDIEQYLSDKWGITL